MPTHVVVKQFTRVASIINDINNHPVNPSHVPQIVKAAELFLSGFKHAPDVFTAQPNLYKSKYRYIENLTFNSLVFCALLCKQNKINDLCCQQLLCSILSLYAERAALLSDCFDKGQPISRRHPVNTGLIAVLNKAHLDVWHQGYALYPLIFKDLVSIKKWPSSLSRLQHMVLCAHWLAVGVTHKSVGKSMTFAACLRQLVQYGPQGGVNDLQRLIEYPGLIPPGNVIKLNGKQNAIVLSVGQERCLVNKLSSDKDQPKQLASVAKSSAMYPLNAQVVSGFNQIHHWWDEKWQAESVDTLSPITQSVALDKPPAVLLEVQTHLNSDNVDIDKLAVQISAEPAFSEYLKRTATFSNRNKIPVLQVKHGLMMHGYLRTNNMLIEQALLLRLNQSYFPLQQEFTQFTRLTAQIAYNLASHGESITPEQASNLACFACSGLFTQSRLKTRTRWQPVQKNHYDLRNTFSFSHRETLIEHALILCKSWQQPTLFTSAIEQHKVLPEAQKTSGLTGTLACILGLSISAAKHHFFSDIAACEPTQTYISQGLARLAMTATEYQSLCAQALAQTHCYRTLN